MAFGGRVVSLSPLQALRARRAWANADPYTVEEREQLRQCVAVEAVAAWKAAQRPIVKALSRRARRRWRSQGGAS